MTNEQRLEQLLKAKELIRQVEFSYPLGDPTRQRLYVVAATDLGMHSYFSSIVRELRESINESKKSKPYDQS